MRTSHKSNIKRRRSIKGGRPPKKLTYQARLIDLTELIKPETLSNNGEIEIKANEYVQNKQNVTNIGDILFCGSTRDRQEYGFYIVLPDGKNKVVLCLSEGWGMGWISGGVIDKKDILHQYHVKYDDMLSRPIGIFEFDQYFLGNADSTLPQQIIHEFRQNNLLS